MRSRNSIGAVVVAVVVLALGLASCGGDDGGDSASSSTSAPAADARTDLRVVEDDLDDQVSDALATATQQGHDEVSASGAIVGVRTADGTWIATVGSTTFDGTDPMTADMHQRIGSITKTATSTLLLQLAGEGRLSMDDPIERYVPGTPNPQATLGQLSAMRSGILSYTAVPEFATTLFAEPEKAWEPQELVDLVEGSDPLFEPGSEWDYSNTNIVLLGMVIEQVARQPVHELVAERIAGPLGLVGTELPTDATLPDPHARGFTVQGQDDRVPLDVTDWNPSWAWTAGAMISTVEDLLTYSRELVVGGTLLDPDMQAVRIASMQSQGPDFPPDHDYGYGLQQANGWWGHTGELPGFNTFMYHQLAQDLTVVVMVNSDIKSGGCAGGDVASTMAEGGRTTGPCIDPAVHVADFVTAALGYPGNPGDLGPATASPPTSG
jgi:D-alanyl-D-alanine carboxypeptidase